jgi:hypothetical protein
MGTEVEFVEVVALEAKVVVAAEDVHSLVVDRRNVAIPAQHSSGEERDDE